MVPISQDVNKPVIRRHLIKLAGVLALASAMPERPVAANASSRTQGAALASACSGRDGWNDTAPPAEIFGGTWYVGTCGISVLLITGSNGHILVDAGPSQAAPAILANIRAAGYNPRDIRLIVGSHEHLDHMGGFAALKAATGARLIVRDAARPVVESGQVAADDPQRGVIENMPPVVVDGTVADGEVLRLGAIALTAVATPGHTAGGTSWTWRSCDKTRCVHFAYVDSLSAVSSERYRFSNHPERVAPFRTTFAHVDRLSCDILVTPHPEFSNLFPRLAGLKALVDRGACKRLSQVSAVRLDERLKREASMRPASPARQ